MPEFLAAPAARAALLAAAWLVLCAAPCRAQKGIGSLNDPCDCMSHHDFWMSTRSHLKDLFWTANFAERMFDPDDAVHKWVMVQSCMYSPENEESHRPTALSDCIPGFLLVHIVCMQRQLAERRVDKVMEYATELARLLPWGMNCIDNSDWPLTSAHVEQYYRRLRRTFAAGPPVDQPWPEELLRGMAWLAPDDSAANGTVMALGEEPETCPYGSLPDCGVCWLLGPPGQPCSAACSGAGLAFREPAVWPAAPLTPRILALTGALPDAFAVQHGWAPFECFVSKEARFHLALPTEKGPMPSDWSYPICELACPCIPEVPQALMDALQAVPDLDEL